MFTMSKLKFSPDKIKEYRLRKGWTIEELGLRSGINPAYLGKMERGKTKITTKSATKIAEAFGCWLDELFL